MKHTHIHNEQQSFNAKLGTKVNLTLYQVGNIVLTGALGILSNNIFIFPLFLMKKNIPDHPMVNRIGPECRKS